MDTRLWDAGIIQLIALLFCVSPLAGAEESDQAPPDEEKARIAVFLPENREDSRYDGLCSTIEGTIALNLKLIGTYRVVQPGTTAPETEEKFLEYVQEKRIDNAVYGNLFLNDEGTIVIEVSVYDRRRQEITRTERVTAQSYFDIFSAADEIVTSLLGTFSDRHIAYGSLQLVNDGVEGAYTVLLNGNEIGKSITSIPRLLTGEYTLSIVQQRLTGRTVVDEQEIEVEYDKREKISFSIPSFIAEEEELFRGIDKEIMHWWGSGEEKVRSELEKALRLTEKGAAVSSEMERLNTLYRDLLNSYKVPSTSEAEMTGESQPQDAPGLSSFDLAEVDRFVSKYDLLEDPSSADVGIERASETAPEFSQKTVDYTTPYIAEVLPEEKKERKSFFRLDTQIAGGSLGMTGINLAGQKRRHQLSVMAGVGYAGPMVELGTFLAAGAAKYTWKIFSWVFSPTFSLYANYFSNFERYSLSGGPSLGFSLAFNDGTFVVYLENYFSTTIMPVLSSRTTYLPALGVKF